MVANQDTFAKKRAKITPSAKPGVVKLLTCFKEEILTSKLSFFMNYIDEVKLAPLIFLL